MGTGSGLMVASLLMTWFLSEVDVAWAVENRTLLATFGWAQQAALVLGAALIAAGLVVVRLTPAGSDRLSAGANAPTDWFA